jgi:hypothetical protein
MTRYAFLDNTQIQMEFADDGTPVAFITPTGKRTLLGAMTTTEHIAEHNALLGQITRNTNRTLAFA